MSKKQQKLDAVFHALAEQTRRRIIDELNQRPQQTLFEICIRLTQRYRLNLTRQAITKHLKVLEAADIVRTSWKGRTKIHSLNLNPVRNLGKSWLGDYLGPRETKR